MSSCGPVAAAILALVIFMPAGHAQTGKTCPKIEVMSLRSEARLEDHRVTDSTPQIEVIATDAGRKTVTFAVVGPMLGSMDSPTIRTQLTCTQTGVNLTATLIRSENYKGDTLQNQLWRPLITVLITLSSAEAVLASTWKMQLTNGKELGRARTPPYPELVYPIRVQRTVRAP